MSGFVRIHQGLRMVIVSREGFGMPPLAVCRREIFDLARPRRLWTWVEWRNRKPGKSMVAASRREGRHK